LPALAADILMDKQFAQADRILAQWVLGLNNKAFQNVLRSDPEQIAAYRDMYVAACNETIANHSAHSGALGGTLQLDKGSAIKVDWLMMLYLMNAIGVQTLAIRGSDKSAYGKLFEKLILGSLLSILDFRFTQKDQPESLDKVFWLSSRNTDDRESDATLLYS